MNQKLRPVTRLLTLLSSLAIIAVLFFPMWRIELTAPQYPEGLKLVIFPHKLGGNVDVVNGLNHYIGMRTLHAEDFIEFTVLPYIIGTLAFFGLLTLFINRRWFFTAWSGFFILFGIIAMIDFYRWEYNYGHNLDPTAPIRVPGMSYQPPLIGYKQLLNFGAYSVPDIGGWLFIAVGLILVAGLVIEFRKTITNAAKGKLRAKSAAMILMVMMGSCNTGPVALVPGVDACSFCKMSITETKFGSEWITSKGRVFKFDDTHCLIEYLKARPADETGTIWFVDFTNPGVFIPSNLATFLKSDALHSPMGSNMGAFQHAQDLEQYRKQLPGKTYRWEDIKP